MTMALTCVCVFSMGLWSFILAVPMQCPFKSGLSNGNDRILSCASVQELMIKSVGGVCSNVTSPKRQNGVFGPKWMTSCWV